MKTNVIKTTKIKGALLGLAVSLIVLSGCSSPDSPQDENNAAKSTQSDENVPSKNPDGQVIVKATIMSVSGNELQVKAKDTTMTVKIIPPFHLYERGPGSLADVQDSSFVGVTTNKQPDGSDQAAEIHIFPNELRGLGEGSNMMNKGAADKPGRMTNGSVTAARMTNGNVATSRMTNGKVTASGTEDKPAAASRMSNGSVKHSDASTLEIQYQGHTRKITVPANIPVTEFKLTATKLAPGVRVDLLAKKDADGSLSSGKGILQKN